MSRYAIRNILIQRKLIIFTAVQIETRAIAKMLKHPHPGWPAIELHTIGIRAVHLPPDWSRAATQGENAQRGTGILPVSKGSRDSQPVHPDRLRSEHGQDARATVAIIMAGLAGALHPALQIGDVVIDAASDKIPGNLKFRRGKIYTADRLIATPAVKADLFHATGALVVEMENAIIRAAANAAGIPFIGIRAVSDTADQALDPAVLGLVDNLGRMRPLAIAGTLLRRPALIPYLNRLGAASRLAADRLAEAVREILDAGIPSGERLR